LTVIPTGWRPSIIAAVERAKEASGIIDWAHVES